MRRRSWEPAVRVDRFAGVRAPVFERPAGQLTVRCASGPALVYSEHDR